MQVPSDEGDPQMIDTLDGKSLSVGHIVQQLAQYLSIKVQLGGDGVDTTINTNIITQVLRDEDGGDTIMGIDEVVTNDGDGGDTKVGTDVVGTNSKDGFDDDKNKDSNPKDEAPITLGNGDGDNIGRNRDDGVVAIGYTQV